MPLVRPVIVHEPETPVTVQVLVGSPTTETVWNVGTAPVDADATVTVTCVSPATAVGVGGVSGGVYTPE